MARTDTATNVAAHRPPGASPAVAGLRRLAGRAVDAVLPPQCLRCRIIVGAPGALCAPCWEGIRFVASPQCQCCGMPFEFDPGEGVLCGPCSRRRPPYHRARAAMVYDHFSRDLILAFKHGDRTDAAPALGRWMGRAGRALLAEVDLVAPVPLHWTRLFARRYNQAALLAGALARGTGVIAVPDLLVRRRRTPSLGGLGPARRRQVVARAFAPHPRRRHLIDGRRVLLVDDVLTTGATVSACTRVLLGAGARAVDVLTLARVVRPEL